MTDIRIPASDLADSDDVAVALETARAHLEQGAPEDAARWLNRAARAAAAQGNSDRSAVLAKTALEIASEQGFEAFPDEEQVLSDIDEDDFSEQTIVDDAPAMPQIPGTFPPTISTTPTPIAAPPRPARAATYNAVRVAVRKDLGGVMQVRPLSARESAGKGEEEALLVPLRAGAKLI